MKAKVGLRPESLSDLKNAGGTLPSNFEIRFDYGREKIAANVLKHLLEDILPSQRFFLEETNTDHSTRSPTLNYISVWLGPIEDNSSQLEEEILE
ncbi:hypothetical protein [Fischerella sp. PCC 9605]|uniref:hypothetical protein n=1 Tax=Fischerella sp. PCC 9605 TaxID=1173024 RepID=UPI00047D634F|nr:hypothetical protein [Fischerella sp. PCC 9605]